METHIAHRCLSLKDSVTLGFVGHLSNLTGCSRLAPQSKSKLIFSDSLIEKRTKNWLSDIGIFSEF